MRVSTSLSFLVLGVAAEFVPGGSFGRPTIGPYNNCSGTLTLRPKDLAIDTLPNINSNAPVGWERWDLTMHQPGFFLSLRWIQGDPAFLKSVPADATFELVAKFSNGTFYRTSTSGHKLTFTNESGYSISIAGNTLSWDDSQSWFNTTLSVNGLNATFGSQSIMLDKFSPYAGWIVGQLTENLFSGIPMTRGRSYDGSIVFPWGESVSLDAGSVLNHMFSTKPLQTLATNYAFRVFWSTGADFGDTFIHESSRSPNGSQYEAFFLGRAETRGSSFEPYTFYAGTNSDILSIQRISPMATHAQLAGCARTGFVPFSWNYTVHEPPIAEDFDSAGGKTSYHLATAVAPESFGRTDYQQIATGLVQIYEAAGAAILQNTPDSGGEQPPNPYALSS